MTDKLDLQKLADKHLGAALKTPAGLKVNVKLLNHAKLTAEISIGFSDWLFDNHWIDGRAINSNGKFWYKQYTTPSLNPCASVISNRVMKTTSELFQTYINQL